LITKHAAHWENVMANELDTLDLDNLSIDKVREMKNAAVERLKKAGDIPLLQTGHQNGTHSSHTNHATHANGPLNDG
jgi:hypothetical protein